MVPQHALVALLSCAIGASAQRYSSSSTSAFWTVTSRFAAATPSPYVYTYYNGQVSTELITDMSQRIKPTVTPTATPLSTSVYDSYYNGDVEVKYEWFAANAVAQSDLEPTDDSEEDYSSLYPSVTPTTTFSMMVTMTAPASCQNQFTVTTSASVSIPSLVRNQITPSSTIDGGISTLAAYYTYSVQTWILSAGAAPFTSTDDYYYRYYVASCSTPPGARTTSSYYGGSGSGSGSGSGYRGSNDDDDYYGSRCYRYSYYCSGSLTTWIIIIASVIPGLFLLGLLESWFWFRRLMMGKSAMRFGTVCWVLLSLWVLCFTRMQDARSTEDQKVLQEKWKNMKSGAAFKAWLKWGLRRAYPVQHLGQYSKLTVGIVPAGQPLHPAMAQTPPGYMPGPPPPGAPGQVYYYGPPPPGWVPTPDGTGFMPPQGYNAGYYAGDVSKVGTVVSSSPVSQHHPMLQQPQGYPVSPMGTSPAQPQAPQPAYHGQSPSPVSAPSPPPQGPVPAPPIAQATSHPSEAPANPVQRPADAPQPTHPKSDPNDRSLYD